MSIVRYYSDPHFFHYNMAIKRGFKDAFEMNDHIITEWNKIVKKRDVTWILGDITMEKANYAILNKLNGIKKIILGNHDQSQHIPKLLEYVNSVCAYYKDKGILFSHIPIHESEIKRFKYNIHGHTHEYHILAHSSIAIKLGEKNPKYINVCAEVIDYKPKTIEELINENTNIK